MGRKKTRKLDTTFYGNSEELKRWMFYVSEEGLLPDLGTSGNKGIVLMGDTRSHTQKYLRSTDFYNNLNRLSMLAVSEGVIPSGTRALERHGNQVYLGPHMVEAIKHYSTQWGLAR
ncbi:MAG: hypothetical protein JW727_05890 [Candidatus Aenigmarchaeota archaeon]|nr:hypothetical protein [Candidatus Aenigmarchaeota archaeon]